MKAFKNVCVRIGGINYLIIEEFRCERGSVFALKGWHAPPGDQVKTIKTRQSWVLEQNN
jgi:hypothetical protein